MAWLSGRVVKNIQPDINGRVGRTVEYFYSYAGNPFRTKITDSIAGSSETEVDLLGRTKSSKDIWGNEYTVSYDRFGRVANSTGPVGTESSDYDSYDRPTNYKLDGVIYATIAYDAYGRIETITYPEAKDSNGEILKLTQAKRDALQRSIGSIYQTSDAKTYDETVNLTQSGVIVGSTQTYDTQTITSAYGYDGIGRLTSANVGETRFNYGYDAPNTVCDTLSGNNANAHRDSNRTTFSITNIRDNVETYSNYNCHDLADRLLQSSDSNIGAPTYDDHGNTSSLSGNGTPILFKYDANDKNIAIEQGSVKVEYVKTASGNVIRKKEYDENGLQKSYRFVAGGKILQSCSLTDENDCATVDTYLTLPGSITLTKSPTNPNANKQTVYSLKNFHGDTVLTFTSEGKTDSTSPNANLLKAYGPFGEELVAGTLGASIEAQTNATDATMGWAAHPNRKIESKFSIPIIQMGARVYLPTLGRFLQVDPVLGGTLNDYVYAHDPINMQDYVGLCISCLLQPAGSIYLQGSRGFNQQNITNSLQILKVITKNINIVGTYFARSTTKIALTGTTISFIGDYTSGISIQAKTYGQQLRLGSSIAGKNLPSVGALANKSIVKVIGKWAGPIGASIEFGTNSLNGDSMGRNLLKTGTGYALGAAGATFGGFVCGTAAFVTLGLGAAGCPVAVGTFGAGGSMAGNKLGEGIADMFGW